MHELRTLREDWEMVEAEETRLLQSMTVQASVRQWLALQRAFEPQLQQTAAMFAPERQAALAHCNFGSITWKNGRNNMENLFHSIQTLQRRLNDPRS